MADENEAVATVDPLADAATEENEAAATVDPLADVAADEDNLYEDGYVKGTADYIKECATPMTIAIQGNWGVGKTSLFNLITKEFQVKAESKEDDSPDEEKYCEDIIGVEAIDIGQRAASNPDENLFDTIFVAVLSKIAGHDLKTVENVSGIASVATQIISEYAVEDESEGEENAEDGSFLGGILNALFSAEEEKKSESEDNAVSDEDIEAFKNAITDALRQSAEEDGKTEDSRFVVFIDGLDHIEPKAAVDIMEKMKTFLECSRCVFVYAIDETAVYDGVRAKFGDKVDEGRRKMFFEKHVQVPLSIPTSSYDLDKYFKHLLKDEKERSGEFAEVANALLIAPTPRTIKRYVNTMYENLSAFEESGNVGSASLAMLFAAVILKVDSSKGFDAVANCAEGDMAHFAENLKAVLESLGHDDGINWEMLPTLWRSKDGIYVDALKRGDFLSWIRKLK